MDAEAPLGEWRPADRWLGVIDKIIPPSVSVAISYPREPVPVGHRAPFRMKLSASPSGQFNALSFDSIELHFSTDRPAVVIDGVANEEPMSVGDILLDDDATSGHSGSLSFKPGQSKVITGSLSSSSPTVGGVSVSLPLNPHPPLPCRC